MTARNGSPDYDDADIVALIASLDLVDINATTPPRDPPTPPPTSPPPAAHRTIEYHTFPSIPRSRVHPPPSAPQTPSPSAPQTPSRRAPNPKVYLIESPTKHTSSQDWATAGAATQGVANARVRAIGRHKKKPRHGNAAFVVFYGLDVGVFLSWQEVDPLVTGVSCSLFRGYSTLAAAEAAFQFVLNNSWVRRTGDHIVAAIPRLPQPIHDISQLNVLNDTEDHDATWYVVYRGITPGVYRSHLESQLNTVGVSGALHERIQGKAEALRKFAEVFRRGEVNVVAPPYPDAGDVFL
ncbi:hypothetical protein DFH07DRAFT_967254 [Mycena maculata]|uniref:Ribonuclease H1 N-terminal domain-containing protein n=1 Tax=Mycena maculata TaxID=230809 RepID=A0AAD7I503_9AGAR|nr:hypothetical protein DFH07DRAFT_967254 [Mycena maculata]